MQFTARVTSAYIAPQSVERDALGRLLPGHGLKGGRPKGVDVRAEFAKAQGSEAPAKAVVEVMLAMIAKAIGGDVQAARVVLERLAGPVRQEVDLAMEPVQLDDAEVSRRLVAILSLAAAKKAQERN